VPLIAKFKDLSGSIKTIFTGNDLPYKIEGTADVSTVFRNHKFTFSKEGLINLKN